MPQSRSFVPADVVRSVRAFALAAVVLVATIAQAVAAVEAPAAGLAVLSADSLLADVTRLASPRFDGRLSGSPGYLAAVDLAAARFAALGLEPGGDAPAGQPDAPRGWRQWFDAEYCELLAPPRLTVIARDGAQTVCRLGADFTARGFTGSGDLTAPVVFAGYGLSQPARGYDDYARLDVKGKIVLCFKPNPAWSPDSTGWDADSGTPRQKGLVARAHGAVALLWCETAAAGKPARAPIGSVLHGPGAQPEDFPQLEISESVADRLLGKSGEAARLRAKIDDERRPRSRTLPTRAAVSVQARYAAAHPTCNVVGVLRGGDPALAGQALVIGGHLDHVGRQGPDLYFPGANDNASGASAVLRLAEAFARAGQRPARTVVFVLFAGEESGLDGARFHAAHPLMPLTDTVAMFNLDCVACGDSIQIGSGKTSPELWACARALDAAHDACSVARTWENGGADATPFHEGGVKTLYWVTTNSYPHLHAPEDTPATLNGPLYGKLVRLCFRAAWDVADEGRQEWTPRPDWERHFREQKTSGTIVVVDERDGRNFVYDSARAARRFSPASTFKVPHALFALDAGVVKDEFQVFPWDGTQYEIAGWNGDQTLRSSMRYSVVWVYQMLARELGAERERACLDRVGYGNRAPGDDVTRFWLDGSLRISAFEQVAFLRRLYRNELPLTVESQRLVKDVMINEAGRDWILRAKTGLATRVESPVGWWVGWVEPPKGAVFFALNIEVPGGMADIAKREAIGRAVLRELWALPAE